MTVDLAALTNKTSLAGTEQVILNDSGTPMDATTALMAAFTASQTISLGPYATAAALQAAIPASSVNRGYFAQVGSAAPYAELPQDLAEAR